MMYTKIIHGKSSVFFYKMSTLSMNNFVIDVDIENEIWL